MRVSITTAETPEWGIRFPDMTNAYDKDLTAQGLKAGESLEIPVKTGVYAGLKGPSLETPAETRFLQIIRADAVGFSTVCEVTAAVHAGMRVLGLTFLSAADVGSRLVAPLLFRTSLSSL